MSKARNLADLGDDFDGSDLTLSGGVYLGGTGSTNKLDDYEEGDHEVTVTTGSGTVTLTTGGRHIYYVKVGGLVTITGTIRVDGVSSPSGTCTIGLPFVNISPASGEGQIGAMVVANVVNTGNINEVALEIAENASVMNIYKASGTNLTDGGDIFKANTTLRFNFSYRTNA